MADKISQSDSKVMVGVKRDGEELEEDSDSSRKHVKTRDLQSVLQSEGIDTHDPETSKMEETEEHMDIVETQSSQVIDKNAGGNTDAGNSEKALGKSSTVWVEFDHNGSKLFDLNSEVYTDDNSGYNDAIVSLKDTGKHSSYVKGKASYEHKDKPLGGTCLDLNAEDVASSANQDPFYAYRSHNNYNNPKTGEKEALRKWKEMKQNGFMSPSYGGIPAAPKQRGRKSKNDVLKQKMEQAKKEQVDRFTKIAAPSGLLNGLNPGIINHVRNSKQVHSIIQALVRSEKRENRRQASEIRGGSREVSEKNTEQENMDFSGLHGSGLPYEVASFSAVPESNMIYHNHLSHNSSSLFNSGDRGGYRDSTTEGGRFYANTSSASQSKNNSEDDILALKLSSSTMVSESTSCLSNGESGNVHSVDTLSVKAATVASQWLQLIQQDIKGRLSALKRSKKRVHAVINIELPFLLSKEFSSNQENNLYTTNSAAELHETHWRKLFNQMDSALSEEEKQLESWLNQVNKMQQQCDGGLQHVQWSTVLEMQHLGALASDFRSSINDPEKDLSVRAAAASIYSTSNFISSMENVSCC